MNNIVLFIYGKVQNQRLNKRKTMKNLILIILITFSFPAEWWSADWYKGKSNPNGHTFAITYTPSDFMGLDADGNSNVKSSSLVIPLTDFFTITQSRFYIKSGDTNYGGRYEDWKGGSPNTQISFHLPVNWE